MAQDPTPNRKLYDLIVEEGLYTKSYDDFTTQFSTPEKVGKLYNLMADQGLYTKPRGEFDSRFFPEVGVNNTPTTEVDHQQPVEQVVDIAKPDYEVQTQLSDIPLDSVARGVVDLGGNIGGISAVDPTTGEITNVIPEVAVEAPRPLRQDLSNIWDNLKLQLSTIDDRMALVSADTWENLLGKELAQDLLYNEDRTIDDARTLALQELQAAEQEYKRVSGIGESIAAGDLSGLLAGSINAIASLGTTAAAAISTLGAGLYTEMVGQALYDYNSEKARQLGISIEELYNQEKADFGVPATIGIIAGSLERIGLKGAQRALIDQFKGAAGRGIAKFLTGSSSREGMTEWLQEGLNAANTELAKPGASTQDVANAFAQRLFSKEGLEAYLMGRVGGAAAGGIGAAGRQIVSRIGDKRLSENIAKGFDSLSAIENDLSNTNLNPITRRVLEENRDRTVSEIADGIISSAEQEAQLPAQIQNQVEERNARLQTLQVAINDPNVSEASKEALQAQAEEVRNEIDGLIKQGETQNDTQNQQRVSGEVREGQEPVQTQSDQEAGGETPSTSGILQTQERQVAAPGSRLFSEPVSEVASMSQQYKQAKNIPEPEGQPIRRLDEDRSKQIADAYEAMPDNPSDPEVQRAYEAMASETLDQFQVIRDNGYTVEIYEGEGEPYPNSTAMLDDLRNNKHLYVLSTEAEFGETPITDQQRAQNPLLRDSGQTDVNGRPLLVNDVFRFVHDVFGHGERGNSFGPVGEENAWDVHARMYTPEARRAMTTETRGQNSWVNFGPHLRDENGRVPKRGEAGYVPVTDRPFAQQKMGLLPEEFSSIEGSGATATSPANTEFGQATTPEQAAQANRSSYERLTEGMAQEQIDADPELVRLRESFENVRQDQAFTTPEQQQIVNTSFLEDIVTEQGRTRIKEQASARIREFIRGNQEVTPDGDMESDSYQRYLAEYDAGTPEQRALFNSFAGLSSSEILNTVISNTQNQDIKTMAGVLSQFTDRLDEFKIMPGDWPWRAMIDDKFRITLNTDQLFNRSADFTVNNGQDSAFKTLLHEYVHAITLSAYRNPRTQADRDFKKFVDSSYKSLKNSAEFKKSMYGFVSPTEFISELLTNTEFRKLAPVYKKGLVERFLDYIRQILGLNTTTSQQLTEQRRKQVESAFSTIVESLPNITMEGTTLGTDSEGAAITPEQRQFVKDLTEYAAVSLIDGSIKTAKGLSNAIGVPLNPLIQQAFDQAKAIQEQVSQSTVTPKKRSTKSQIKQATEKGIQGKVDLTNRQALKDRFQLINRSIREGRKQIKTMREEVAAFIKDMREQGLFRGKVRGSTVAALLNRVNKANSEAQIQAALNYAEKASRILDYDQKYAQARKMQGMAKRISKRKSLPADLKPLLSGIGRVNLAYVDNIDNFLEQITTFVRAVDSGTPVEGIRAAPVQNTIDTVKRLVQAAEENRLRERLLNAGMTQDFVDGLDTMRKLLDAVAQIPDDSKPDTISKREFRERVYGETRELLATEVDPETLSPAQRSAYEAIINIDFENLSDADMALLSVVANNAYVNGSYAGAGPLIAEYRHQRELANKDNVQKVKETVRIPGRLGRTIREKFGTVIAQIDATMRDRTAVSAFHALTGMGDYITSSVKYANRVEEQVLKMMDNVARKYGDDIRNPVQSALFSMYADLNQFKRSWTAAELQEEFNARKQAIAESIARLEQEAAESKYFANQNKEYIENVKKAYAKIANTTSAKEIYDQLNTGYKVAYRQMRGFFDKIQPEMRDNALIYNNINMDEGWVNYFPRSYRKLGSAAQERRLEQLEELALSAGMAPDDIVNSGEASGAKQSRLLSGKQLPARSTINFDAMDSFYTSAMKAIYDIETQPARQYAARALNSKSTLDVFGDATPIDIFRNALVQKITNDQYGLLGGQAKGFKVGSYNIRVREVLQTLGTWNTRLALGGVGQIFKQSIPQLTDAMARLGNNGHLLGPALHAYFKYPDLVNQMLSDQPVSRRNSATVERQQSVISRAEADRLAKVLNNKVLTGLRIADRTAEFISLGTLKFGDDMAAKASWLAFYLDYRKRNGAGEIDLIKEMENPVKAAKEFATQQVELTHNVSDPSLRANTSRHIGGDMMTLVAPFASFAINAKLELVSNLARVREIRSMTNDQQLRLMRNIGANVANIVMYNVIGKGIRNIMIAGTASLAYGLLDDDEWDEEQMKQAREVIDSWKSDAIARNQTNSTQYLINDLIYGGIADQVLEPVARSGQTIFQKIVGIEPEEETNYYRKRDVFDMLGGFGIGLRTIDRTLEDFGEWTLTDEEWRMRKYSIEDAWGEARYVPLEKTGIDRPLFSRKGYGLTTIAHAAALTGASSQEISALANRLPGLIRKVEEKFHGADVKPDLIENEKLRKITIAGVTRELTEEQFQRAVEIRKDFLRRVDTSDAYLTLQKDELASKLGDQLSEEKRRETATKYARAVAIKEFGLLEGVADQKRKEAQARANEITTAAEMWIKQLNPSSNPKQKAK